MPATTRKTSRRSAATIDRPKLARQRQGQGKRNPRLSRKRAPESSERRLREQVTYLLWVMAQTVD
jgi:hypothetical protein